MAKWRPRPRQLLRQQDTGFELLLIGLLICSIVVILAHFWKARLSWPAAASIGLYPLCILMLLRAGSVLATAQMRWHIKEEGIDWKEISPDWHERLKFRLMTNRFALPVLYLGLIALFIAACRWIYVGEPSRSAYGSFAVGFISSLELVVYLATVRYKGEPVSEEERITEEYEGKHQASSSITLPLWNKQETDVLPQYQLTFGHAICQAPMSSEDVLRLAKFLELGELQYSGDLDADKLPVVAGSRTLGAEREAHLLIAEVGGHQVIFGPHQLIGNSSHWIEWNKKVGGLMAYTTQMDVEEYFHRVFGDGKLILSACAEGDSLRYIEDTPIEVFLGGKRIYHDPGSKPDPTNEIHALLTSDARISEEAGAISIKAFASNQPVRNLRHFAFRK